MLMANASSEEERPKADSLKPLAMLAPFLRPYRGLMLAALAALLVASTALLALPVDTIGGRFGALPVLLVPPRDHS